MSELTIGSLFSGYGGLDMAVESVTGARTAWVSDIDKGACKILAHRYPDVPNIGDLTQIDWTTVEPVDIITGGSPCQDLSHAGKRAGMTDGTRSNLWVAMREAIAALKPSLVIWENVRGAYSAAADSDVEFDQRLLAPPDGRPSLRALGRVLGDLSDLGFYAGWHGLRAADVGACHGRYRVFLVAHARGKARDFGTGLRTGESTWDGRRLPTRSSGPTLLPSPRATDGTNGGPNQRGSSGDLMLPSAVTHLLPTPAVNDMGAGKEVADWDAWTDKMKAAHGNGNGHGASLSIEALRLLPTPTVQDSANDGGPSQFDRNTLPLNTMIKLLPTPVTEPDTEMHDGSSTEGRPDQVLRDVRGSDVPKEVRGSAGGSHSLPESSELLAGLRQLQGDSEPRSPSDQSAEVPSVELSGMRHDQEVARSSHRPGLGERRPNESDDTLRELSPEAALAGGPSAEACGCAAWGLYAPAVHRWELAVGRPAPAPTEPTGKGGAHRLSPRATEWMMGLPDGWITDVPGITRNEALKACGNGVVPQQAAAALRLLLPTTLASPPATSPAAGLASLGGGVA